MGSPVAWKWIKCTIAMFHVHIFYLDCNSHLPIPPFYGCLTTVENISNIVVYKFTKLILLYFFTGTVDVFLSFHGKGPSLFYVQRSDTTKQIQQIMVEIANLIKTGPIPLSDPRPGSVCLAQYTDGVWYRARIEYCSPNSRQIKVGEQLHHA